MQWKIAKKEIIMQKNIPTESDWGIISNDNLDSLAAYRDFQGKTNDEMQVSFLNCTIEMADSLRWMPPIPFRYYMLGFSQFISEKKFSKIDASDIASSFLRLVEEKICNQPSVILPIMDILFPIVEYLADQQEAYGADPSIYGDFSEKKILIEDTWNTLKNKNKNKKRKI